MHIIKFIRLRTGLPAAAGVFVLFAYFYIYFRPQFMHNTIPEKIMES